jgi:hypothetical protein
MAVPNAFAVPVGWAGKVLLPDGRSHVQGGRTGIMKNGACLAADPEAIL